MQSLSRPLQAESTLVPLYSEIAACRLCGCEQILNVLDLGDHYLPAFGTPVPPRAPLHLVQCHGCSLVQLKHSVDRDVLFGDYWYMSGVNSTMRDELKDVVRTAMAEVSLEQGGVVLDIGSNDGTLLGFYPAWLDRAGFEPSPRANKRNRVADCIFSTYFNAESFKTMYKEEKARVVTSVAMFYDLDDPVGFAKDIKRILAPDGVWVCQMNDLASLVRNNAYDFIGHEHVALYDTRTFAQVMALAGLELYKVVASASNGGSLRYFVQQPGARPVVPYSVTPTNVQDLSGNVFHAAGRLHAMVETLARDGKRVYALGASTRGHTILQAAKLDSRLILGVSDRNPAKVGLKYPGLGILIMSEQAVRDASPDYMLVLVYSYLEELREREWAFLRRGGKFVVPIPVPEIVG